MQSTISKIFTSGNSQAVRLPKGFDFPAGRNVYLTKDCFTGDVTISTRPSGGAWDGFFSEVAAIDEPMPNVGHRPLNVPLFPCERTA